MSYLKVSKHHKELINSIIYGNVNKLNPSKNKFYMSDVFMFALALGIKNKKRMKLVNAENTIPISRIEGRFEIDGIIIKTIAMIEENNPELYFDTEKCYEIAEEYANMGFELISSSFKKNQHFNNFILENFDEWNEYDEEDLSVEDLIVKKNQEMENFENSFNQDKKAVKEFKSKKNKSFYGSKD